MNEPTGTAWLLLLASALLGASALVTRLGRWVAVPVPLLFLALGMAAGSEGVGGLEFDDYALAFRVGTIALALILFDGGLNTPAQAVRLSLRPAAVLATAGVALTALIVAAGARLLGWPWPAALLLGAVVSSTDAAAVFAVLRASGIQLRRRLGTTLELESGLNDPLAVILTLALTDSLLRGRPPGWSLALDVVVQLAVGVACGVACGWGGRHLLRRFRPPASGLYPVLSLALACLAFAGATLLGGSGFLAVYLAGMVLGSGEVPYRAGLLRVHDAFAWLGQVSMFLMLGLLVFPSRLLAVVGQGLAVALLLAFVARPLAVLLCLAPFRFAPRERLYVSWIGLRGAVPIVLATFPVMAGAPGAERVFDLVFFVVVVNSFLPGATVRWLTRRLGLSSSAPPPPGAVLEINATEPIRGQIDAYRIHAAAAVSGARLADLPLPANATVMLIVRAGELIAPRGGTRLEPGDHVYVVHGAEDRTMLELLFGGAEDG